MIEICFMRTKIYFPSERKRKKSISDFKWKNNKCKMRKRNPTSGQNKNSTRLEWMWFQSFQRGRGRLTHPGKLKNSIQQKRGIWHFQLILRWVKAMKPEHWIVKTIAPKYNYKILWHGIKCFRSFSKIQIWCLCSVERTTLQLYL